MKAVWFKWVWVWFYEWNTQQLNFNWYYSFLHEKRYHARIRTHEWWIKLYCVLMYLCISECNHLDIREEFKRKRLKRVTSYIFGFQPTLPCQLVTYNLVTFFSKVQTHPTLRISDIKSNFFLLSEIIYSYQVGMGFEIE